MLQYPAMSKVIAYKKTAQHCFCQIRFNSRERVMVSIASVPEHSVKIIKLIAGIFPLKTIWEYKASAANEKAAHKELITLFLGQSGEKADHPLDAIIIKLLSCRSCTEAALLLRKAEQETSPVP
ncbi:MAG: hypothetical protein WA610_11310 [Thermodesulfovibrionales bacterium]